MQAATRIPDNTNQWIFDEVYLIVVYTVGYISHSALLSRCQKCDLHSRSQCWINIWYPWSRNNSKYSSKWPIKFLNHYHGRLMARRVCWFSDGAVISSRHNAPMYSCSLQQWHHPRPAAGVGMKTCGIAQIYIILLIPTYTFQTVCKYFLIAILEPMQ